MNATSSDLSTQVRKLLVADIKRQLKKNFRFIHQFDGNVFGPATCVRVYKDFSENDICDFRIKATISITSDTIYCTDIVENYKLYEFDLTHPKSLDRLQDWMKRVGLIK